MLVRHREAAEERDDEAEKNRRIKMVAWVQMNWGSWVQMNWGSLTSLFLSWVVKPRKKQVAIGLDIHVANEDPNVFESSLAEARLDRLFNIEYFNI